MFIGSEEARRWTPSLNKKFAVMPVLIERASTYPERSSCGWTHATVIVPRPTLMIPLFF